MEAIKNLLEGMAALLWPVIVICVLFLFRPAVAALIESARARKFTLKIGGQELTMDEVNEQQRTVISDLQKQIVEIRKLVESRGAPAAADTKAVAGAPAPAGRMHSILWVDDNPRNNSYYVQQLSDLGIKVDLAVSTSEGLERFRNAQYDCVISDMGRREGNSFNAGAGMDLLRSIRAVNAQVPFVFFSSSRAIREQGDQAIAAGATGVTSSPTGLYALLHLSDNERVA